MSASFVQPVDRCHGCARTILGFEQLDTRFDGVNIQCCPLVLPQRDASNNSRLHLNPRVHAYTFDLDAAVLRMGTGVCGSSRRRAVAWQGGRLQTKNTSCLSHHPNQELGIAWSMTARMSAKQRDGRRARERMCSTGAWLNA